MESDRYVRKKTTSDRNFPPSTTIATAASNPNLESTHLDDNKLHSYSKQLPSTSGPSSSSTSAKSFTHLNLMTSQQDENLHNSKNNSPFSNSNKRRSVLKNRARSDAYLHNHSYNNVDDCKQSNSSSIENSVNSPYKSLKRGQLKLAVLAVKDRLMNKNSQKKETYSKPMSLNSTSKQTKTKRLINCQKELDTCLRYFSDVVAKDRLLMLPGSASILLDIVVKLLLLINENSQSYQQSINNQEETSNGHSELRRMLHNDVYHCLAKLLKVADKLIFSDKSLEKTEDAKGHLAILSNKLCDILKDLISKSTNIDQSCFTCNEIGQSSQTPFITTSPDRRSSLSSRFSGSSGISEIGPEELPPVGSTPSKRSRAVLSDRCSSLDCGFPKSVHGRPPLPPDLVITNPNHHLQSELSPRQTNDCPSVADSADSALGSCQDGEIELSKLEDKILDHNYGGIFTANCSSNPKNNDDGSLSPPKQPFFFCSTSTPIVQVADDVIDDHRVTSEEKEERVGDKIVKTTKVTTRKIVKKTVVTTKEATILSNGSINDLMTDPTISEFEIFNQLNLDGSTGTEFKLTETENFFVKNLNTSEHSENGDSSIDSYVEKEDDRTRNSHTSNAMKRTMKREQNLLHQSCSVQSISKKALLNGKLLAEKKELDAQNSLLMASKSDTFENGVLSETRQQGKIKQNGWSTREESRCNTQDDETCQNRERPKISGVLSYIHIFGHNEPLNETDFTAVSLASYVQMRDKWRRHEEAWHLKELNFEFGHNSAGSSSFSPPKFDSPYNSRHRSFINGAAAPKSIADFERQASTMVPDDDDWLNSWSDINKGATAPRTVRSKYDRDDLYNLMELLDMDERLKFPHRFIVKPDKEAMNEEKYLPFRKQMGLPFVNYLDEIDVKRFLTLNNKAETEDGPEIKGGPVDALIVYATNAGYSSKGFLYQEAFLSTYRTFVSPHDLLMKLIYRYEKFLALSENGDSNTDVKEQEYNKIVKNTFSLIVCIVDDLSPADLTDNVLCALSDFLYRMICGGQLNTGRYLRQRLTKRVEYKHDYNSSMELPLMKHSSSLHPQVINMRHKAKVTDFKSELLAEQFVYLDWYYFKRIELSEMLLWSQQQTEEHSPNLAAFTNHFNKMSYWVRTRILSCSDVKERESIFAKFLKVMQYLRQMNNFNSLFAMLSALDSGSIRRLDWPKALTETLSRYTPLTDSSQSFKAYRHALAETKPPCLPYIGIILQDLTFVHIGNPNLLPESQCDGRKDNINLMKRWQQHTILDNMRRFKTWPYNVKKNDQVLAFLNDFDDHLNEEQLWGKSEFIKPRSNQPKRN